MSPREPLYLWTAEVKKRAGYGVAWAVLLLTLLLSAACGDATESGPPRPEYPDDAHTWPYPSAEELCGTEAAWPDEVHFVTAEYVMRRFREKTGGYALERPRSLDTRGARTFIEVEDPNINVHGKGIYDVFGQFVLSIIDPKCPALIEWLGVDGQPGPGGLVWHLHPAYGTSEGCWAGDKRYPRSNVVVNWTGWTTSTGGCERRVNKMWKRLDAVLREITRGR